MMDNKMEGKICKCPHHSMIPLLVVVFGLVFLLGQLNIFTPVAVNIMWPIVVIIAGLTKLMGKKCQCC